MTWFGGWLDEVIQSMVFNFVHATIKFHCGDLLIVVEGGDKRESMSNLEGPIVQNGWSRSDLLEEGWSFW